MQPNISERTLYGIIIEWGGEPPPGKWYRTMYALTGFSVRERKQDAPVGGVAPRTFYTVEKDIMDDISEAGGVFDPRSNDFGGIAQEGTIIVASYSLARTLYLLLDRGFKVTHKGQEVLIKPVNVYFATLTIETSFSASPADEVALNRIMATMGKRGPRPEPKHYVVTCYEEVQSFSVEASSAIRCPKCGGQHIRPRLGEVVAYADPGGNIIKAWLRLRFGYGHWENTGIGTAEAPALKDIKITDPDEFAFVKALASSPLMDQIEGMGRADQFKTLDAVMTARLRWQDKRRSQARAASVTQFFLDGGSPMDVELIEDEFDIFDAAGVLGKQFVSQEMLRYLKSVNEVEEVELPSAGSTQKDMDAGLVYVPYVEEA